MDKTTLNYFTEYREKIISKFPNKNIELIYPLASFTIKNGTLFILETKDEDKANESYKKNLLDIDNIDKEINRLYKVIDGINSKFINENWLTKCPKDLILKEYKKLNDMEDRIDSLVASKLNLLYPKVRIKMHFSSTEEFNQFISKYKNINKYV